MAYTTPRTWVDGETPTAAQLNTNLRDNVAFLFSPDSVHAYRTNNLTLTTATWTLVPFGAESWDSNAQHDNSTNTSRLIAATSGRFLVNALITFAANGTGTRRVQIRQNAGGSDSAGNSRGQVQQNAVNSGNTGMNITRLIPLSAGDYVECFVYQDSGGNLDLNNGTDMTFFEMHYLGN